MDSHLDDTLILDSLDKVKKKKGRKKSVRPTTKLNLSR